MASSDSKNGLLYEGIIMGFFYAAWVMRQRSQIQGIEYLKNLPNQVVFTITHDSYFEIPSLSRVYKAITPRPVFTVMGKEEFLSGRYLSTNFFKNNVIAQNFFRMVDMTGIPKKVFEKLNVISIPRPFADMHEPKYQNVRNQISSQLNQFKDKIADGFSTLIFPEGTTWGYGGLRKIRSAVYQLVSTSFDQYGKKVYILPINVKVDRLMKGWKDVFINVGKPHFFIKSREEFNLHIHDVLERLHTITFSQVAAYYLKALAEKSEQSKTDIKLARTQLVENLENAVYSIQGKVRKEILPGIDEKLVDNDYFTDKIQRFICYCEGNKYLSRLSDPNSYSLNIKKILSQHSKKRFRKKNPLGFHANELSSLGESKIRSSFEI
jgi:1-acyl-sn-glycerol-3-phosphate acyltransferase